MHTRMGGSVTKATSLCDLLPDLVLSLKIIVQGNPSNWRLNFLCYPIHNIFPAMYAEFQFTSLCRL